MGNAEGEQANGHDHDVVAKGPCRTIHFAREKNGNCPALEFYESLSKDEQAKALALFKRLADSGSIHNREKFKKLEDGLWEFKPTSQVRFIGDFRPRGRFFVSLGVRKKKDRHSSSDLDRARRILMENDERSQTGGKP